MTRQEMIALLASLEGKVRRQTMARIWAIFERAYPFSYLGSKFTFSSDKDLDRQVNALLLALADEILADIRDTTIRDVDEEDRNAVIAFAMRAINGRDVTERVDSHASRIKYLLEGYIAVCFANGFSEADILGNTSRFLSEPNTWPPMRDAFANADEYKSGHIRSRGFHFGRGFDLDPIKGLILVVATSVNAGWQYNAVLGYRRNGNVIGYRIHRGSDYDCAVCDELCATVHPLDEIVLPAHPHCVCYTTPVMAGEI